MTNNAVIMTAIIIGLPCLTIIAAVLTTHRHDERLTEIKQGLREPKDRRIS
jgi:hypothetical protein